MKKKLIFMMVILSVLCFILGAANVQKVSGSKKQNTKKSSQIKEESNSENWNTEECQKIILDRAAACGCDFTLAASEFEDKIQGIWQAKDFVGWDDSSRYHWDGFTGDVMIFCEKAWIEDGTPWYQPVYACYTTNMNELEDLLKITWSDNRYKDKEMILTIGVCAERNKNYPASRDGENILFILLDDVIVMENNGSYWELERVGDIEMSDALSNVSGI